MKVLTNELTHGVKTERQRASRNAFQTADPMEWLAGGGEMGKLIRSKDWSKTSIGPIASWPQSLKTSVSICLNSQFPTVIYWGADFGMIYNDGYAPILGTKHPAALGNSVKDVWS